MKKEIKERIEAVRHGEVPEGYRRTKDIGIAPLDWKVGQMSDVLHNETRAVPKPDEPYWRLGIRSWAKGTFQAYVDDPKTVDMDELYVVRENDLVVNITFAWEHAIAVASKEDDGLLVSHRFPTYVFDGGNVPQYYKAVVSQRFFKDMLDHISPGGAGRNRVLNRKDFLALPCYIPSIAEQQKIAEILATCDRVIELKQQLLEEKRRQKQWLMQKLLDPNSGVRLPGYSAPWKLCTLGNIMNITSVKRIHQSDWTDNGVRFLRARDIVAAFNDEEPEDYLFISRDKYDEYSAISGKVSVGDLLVTGVGSIGVPYLVRDNNPLYFKDGNVIWFQNQGKIDGDYFFYAFSGSAIQNYIRDSAGIGTVGTYTIESGKKTPIWIPSEKEQKAIANVIKTQIKKSCYVKKNSKHGKKRKSL